MMMQAVDEYEIEKIAAVRNPGLIEGNDVFSGIAIRYSLIIQVAQP